MYTLIAMAKPRESKQATTEWMTIKEAMAYLKVSRRTIYNLCDSGKLPFYTLGEGGIRRFKRSDLDRVLIPGKKADNQ